MRPAFVPVEVTAIPDQTCAPPSATRSRVPRDRRPPGRIEVTLRNSQVVTAVESIARAVFARIVVALGGGSP